MPEIDALILSHEDRLQRSETFATEVAAQMAAISTQLKQVGDKIIEVGVSLKSDIASFRETNADDHAALKAEVLALKTTTDEHSKSLTLLLGDRKSRENRAKAAKKAGFAIVITVLGGIATRWGEVIFTWLNGPHTR